MKNKTNNDIKYFEIIFNQIKKIENLSKNIITKTNTKSISDEELINELSHIHILSDNISQNFKILNDHSSKIKKELDIKNDLVIKLEHELRDLNFIVDDLEYNVNNM